MAVEKFTGEDAENIPFPVFPGMFSDEAVENVHKLREIGVPHSYIVGGWEVNLRDEDGSLVSKTNRRETIKFDMPLDLEKIEKQFIRQAPPSKITATRRQKPVRSDELAILIPDAQIPFQDERAMKLASLAITETMPDEVILLGDMLDFPSLSRFQQRPEQSGQIQSSIDRLHTFMAQIRADVPDAIITYILGNHEERFHKHLLENNAELLGIKRANAEQELGIFTLGHMLRVEELEVNLLSGYPGATYWLTDNLRATHGDKVVSDGSTASAMIKKDPSSSVWFGHVHRQELQWKTTATRKGNTQHYAATPGTLARIDGATPSYGSSVDEEGEVVPRAENWQQGLGFVEYNDRGSNPTIAPIQDGELYLFGKKLKVEDEELKSEK